MRYLVSWVDSKTGRERPGTETNVFMRYANARNVIRFGLRNSILPAGHYHIYVWPEGGRCSEQYTDAYKMVSAIAHDKSVTMQGR